jgi:ATP-dependent Clp protease ATP-binding subunit ClpC
MPELSQGAYLAWRLAAGETARTLHPCIENEFVLIGLCSLSRWLRSKAKGERGLHREQALQAVSVDAQAVEETLQACAVDPDLLCHAVRIAVGKGPGRRGEEIVHRSTACKACFQRAEAIAEAAGATEVHCLHLLAAILEHPGALITRVVTDIGVHIATLRAAVEATLVSLHDCQAEADSAVHELSAGPGQEAHPQTTLETPYLNQYGCDITQEARAGKIDPIIGRKEEILALVRTLHQKMKNIPVLISEPGVSRIAVVKGLAIRIARGDVVAPLRGKRIVELPMGELVRVTPSRRQLAQGLKQAIEEASHNPDIILFIDEMHTVVDTGSAEGGLGIASLLKLALRKGNLRCIGATTVENYRRYMEVDPFFERHCQAIVVNEPSLDEMKEILAQVRPRYEAYHMVSITPEALEAAVELCARHMPDKRFPEKAIQLLDQACSRARISQITHLEALTSAEVMYEVTRETIAATLAQTMGIPVMRLLEPPRDKLQRLAKELQAQVLGSVGAQGTP